MIRLLLAGWASAAAVMAALWLVQRRSNDAGIVDVGWTANLGLLAGLYAWLGPGEPARRALFAVLAAAWSARLAAHLLRDRVLGKPEDGRYRTLRARWGERAQPYFFLFFQFQAALDAVFALPFLALAFDPRPLRACDGLGAALWLAAVAGETLADRQLARHRADPANRGRTCRSGLWRFSRHPNYFFEWLHWWSYAVMAAGGPRWGLSLVPPLLLLYLLLKVTGIPATEEQALKSRGEDYRDYQRTTPMFVPWFPRRG